MIPPNEMAAIQATAESALDTPILITRASVAADAYAQPSSSGTTTVASCNALIGTPNAGPLAVLAERIGTLLLYPVSVPQSLSGQIKPGDTLTITSTGDVLTVHVVRAPQSYSPLLTLLCGKAA